jgi:CBS domain-containing protein
MNEFHEDSFHDSADGNEPGLLDVELAEVPLRKPLEVAPHARIGDVIRGMNEKRTGCALVVDGGELVGIFTERDVLTKVAASGVDVRTITVSEVMTREPDVLRQDATVAFALNRMSVEGYRHIPIVDARGRAVGVVGMRDIIDWLVERYPNEVLNVPSGPASAPHSREGA